MQTLFAILLSIALSWACSQYALRKGRSPGLWFFLGSLFGILALLLIFILPERARKAATAPSAPEPIAQLQALDPDHQHKLWYFLTHEHDQHGPMSLDRLSHEWRDGKVKENTLVWNEGMENWRTLKEVMHLN